MAYDILITGGTIVDGTGKPKFEADIGIRDGVIRDVGKLGGGQAQKTIAAAGHFVAPGFIDITNHSDSNWSLFEDPLQAASITQGVTTILVGNCGMSLAPIASPEVVQGFAKWHDISSVNINWSSLDEFLDELKVHSLGVNIATLVGHGTLRRNVLGNEVRPLDVEETTTLRYLIEKSLREGAFGISSGLSNAHEQIATTEELVAILQDVGRLGGIYKTHLRNEGRDLLASVNEAIQIGRAIRAPVIISHMKAIGRKAWPSFGKALKMIENARDDTFAIHYDFFPYARTGSFLYHLLPNWAREGGFDQMFTRLRDQETRKKILGYLKPETLHFERITIASSGNTVLNGKTIEEIAKHAGQPPEEVMLDIILASVGRATIFGESLSFRNVVRGIRDPSSVVASDGGGVPQEFMRSGKLAHPRSYGAFTHFLHRFVRDEGILSWEEGIKKITSLPAEIVGFTGRGKVQKKYFADLVIFNPETLQDQATYQNPFLPAKGIEWVIVNGRVALESGKATGIGAGEVLRKGNA